MKVTSLASSSKGNAYLVEHDGSVVLVDCGLSYRELNKRGKTMAAGFSADVIQAILITHSHTDHVKGLHSFLKHHDVPVYANMMTAETVIVEEQLEGDAFVCFENAQEFEVGAFTVRAFSIPHDTSDPVGFLIKVKDGAGTYFHGTDIGTPLDSIGLKLAEADVATLESNHDPVMLRGSNRPVSLIQRIAGPRGHLSNQEAARLVKRFASPRLKHLNLAHLSQDCNAPHLAEGEMRAALKEIGREDIEVVCLSV